MSQWDDGTKKSTNNAFTQASDGKGWERMTLNANISKRSSAGVTKAQKEGRNLSTVKGMGGGNHGGAYTRAKGKK